MTSGLVQFAPAVVLALGSIALHKVGGQEAVRLRSSLDSLPRTIAGAIAVDQRVADDEKRIAGMDAYVMRMYVRDSLAAFSLYVGYYESQTQGKSVHSPKNCLPGAGWEPVENRPMTLTLPGGALTINRYLLEKGNQRAIAYYWYQGRDRTSWNEYAVKWELFRDKALHGRSEEALVRIVVPLTARSDSQADSLAIAVAGKVVPALQAALPPLGT